MSSDIFRSLPVLFLSSPLRNQKSRACLPVTEPLVRRWGVRDAEDNLFCQERTPGPVHEMEITKKKPIEYKTWNTTHPAKRQWSPLPEACELGIAGEGGEAGRTGLQPAYDLRSVLGPTLCPDAECDEMQEEGSSMQEMLGSETGEVRWSHHEEFMHYTEMIGMKAEISMYCLLQRWLMASWRVGWLIME